MNPLYYCETCHFFFSEKSESCPDCGSTRIRKATEKEKRQHEKEAADAWN